MFDKASFFDELVKLGAVSDEEARRSLDRLETLEQQKPTATQAARYGALGAGVGASSRAIGHLIEHRTLPTLRSGLAGAATGALTAGAVPLVQKALDRRAEVGTLKKYMNEQHRGYYAPNPPAEVGA